MKLKLSKLTSAILVIALSCTSFLPTSFAIDDTTPDRLIYEARLLDSSGNPLTTAHTVRFSLWSSTDWTATDTNLDGTINTGAANYGDWFEEHTVTPSSKGVISLELGSSTALPTINFTTHKFLQVEIKADADPITSYELIDPTGDDGTDADDRQTIGSSPYSKNTERLDNYEIGTSLNNIALLGTGGKWATSQIPGGTDEDAFILDADDSGTDVTLQFGTTLNEQLYWDDTGSTFVFTDDLNVTGNLDVDGLITAGTGDTAITQADGKLDGEVIADDTIDDDSIDFGMGADQVGADDITMTDEFDNSDGLNVQDVMDDLDAALGNRTYTADNYVTDSETTTESIDALDQQLATITGTSHTQNTDTGTTANTFLLDNDDSGGDVILQFGNTLNERLSWNNALSYFSFTDDLVINGELTVTEGIHAGSLDLPITTIAGYLDGEYILDDSIDEDSIDWGTGLDQISAVDLPFDNSGGYLQSTEVESALDEIAFDAYSRWSTGLVSGGEITDGGGNTVDIAAGTGFINYDTDKNIFVSWNDITAEALDFDGDNYIYIDNTGSVYFSQIPPRSGQRIFLGYAYTVQGNSDVGLVAAVPSYVGDYQQRVNSWVNTAIGPLVSSGNLVSEGTPNLTLNITSGRIFNNLKQFFTTDTTSFTKWHKSDDDDWQPDLYNTNYVNPLQYNNLSADASTNLTGTSTFTNGSTNVSGSGTSYTTEVTAGDYVYLSGDTYVNRVKVATVNSNTQLTLENNYAGTGGAGTGVVDESLVNLTSGYWKKDLVLRTMDGNVHYVYAQAEYATEDEAKEAALPTIPTAIAAGGSVYLASIVSQSTDTSINNRLYDVRPNLERVFGFGTSGTTGSNADHGTLIGLTDDDHPQYFNTDGSDTMGGNLKLGTNSIIGGTIDGDDVTLQDIDWSSIKTRPITTLLIPEINSYIIDEDGSDNLATIKHGYDSVNDHQYLVLRSAETDLQDLDIYIQFQLPSDFDSWQAIPIQINLKSTTIQDTDNQVDVTMDDTANAAVTLTGGDSIHSDVANTWVEKDITFGGSPTWTAGDFVTIRLNLQAKNNNGMYIGEIKLNYNGK